MSWPARLQALDQQRFEVGAGGVERSGESCGAGADDDDVEHDAGDERSVRLLDSRLQRIAVFRHPVRQPPHLAETPRVAGGAEHDNREGVAIGQLDDGGQAEARGR